MKTHAMTSGARGGEDALGTKVAFHDDDGIAEIYCTPLAAGQPVLLDGGGANDVKLAATKSAS